MEWKRAAFIAAIGCIGSYSMFATNALCSLKATTLLSHFKPHVEGGKFPLTCARPVLGATRARPGRGCLYTPPLLTRLLGHLATSGRRRLKALQKSFRKYFGHFLGQVKGKVTRGHRRSNFPDFFVISIFFSLRRCSS